MANGYIGKISAIVTASTADLERKLRGAKGEVEKFGRSLNSTIASASRSAENSLNGIFTPLQKLQRALQAGSGRLRLIDPGDIARIQRTVQIAEDLNKPLAAVSRQFTGLSRDIAAEFAPALRKAQTEVLFVNNTLANLGVVSERTFNRATQTVNQTTAAIKRLREAQSLVSSGPSTRDLAFTAPGVTDALRAASARRQQVSLLPADERAGARGQLQNLENVEQKIVQLQARLESLRLNPKANPSAIAATEKEIQRLVAAAARIEKGFQIRVDAKKAQADVDAFAKKAKADLDSLKNAINLSLTGRAQNIQQTGAALARLQGEVGGLPAGQRGAFGGNLLKLADIVASGDISRLSQAQTIIAQIESDLAAQKKLNLDTADAQKKLDTLRSTLNGIASGLSRSPADPFAALKQGAERAKRAVDSVSDATRRQQLQQRLSRVQADIAADAGNTSLSPAALRRLALRRAAALNQIGDDAGVRTSTDIFGAALGSGPQVVASLQGQIQSLQSRIAELPAPLQTKLIPSLNKARDAFAGLGTAPTARQIADATKQAQNLERQLRRAQAAAQFSGTFRSFLNDTAAQRYASQLKSVQAQLAAVGATAGGPVAAAVNKYQRALFEAGKAGRLGTEATKRQMEALLKTIAQAAVQANLFTKAQAKAFVANVGQAGNRGLGDVARLGVDRFSLALQQAAFVVDDFFSVTGGLDQRLRAVGNNISQLAFLLGGTTGLIAGVSLTVGVQLANALVKYVNAGRTSADTTKTLNDSLEKQISIADELKRAFDGLTDTLLEGGFSRQAEELRSFRKELDEVNKLLRQAREERVVELDEGVVRARADIAVAQNRLRGATTPAQALAAQEQLRQAQDRERQARERITQGGPPELNQVFDRLIGAVQAQVNESSALVGGGFVGAEFERGQRNIASLEQARLAAQAAGNPREAAQIQLDAARAQLADVRDGARGSIEAARQFEQVIRELELRIQEIEVDNVAVNALEQSSAAQRAVAAARGRIDGSSLLSRGEELDRASEARERAIRQVEAARRAPGGVEAREAAIAEAVRGLQEADRQAIEVANKFSSLSASVETFASVLDRVSNDLANTVAQEARGAADQARRDANAAQARLGGPRQAEDIEFANRRRSRLEEEARAADDRRRQVERENSLARQRFEADAVNGNLGARDQELIRQRDEAQAVLDDQKATADQRAAATRSRDEANAQLDRRFEDSPAGRAARARADRADVEAQQAAQREADILRGRELAETPAAQAGRELADNLRGLEQFFGQQVEDGALNRQDADAQLAEARRRQIDEAFRSQAPAIAGLADSVANAVLQGPSRAALNATDVSTVEGARELNRLIRGDDAARDQNLEELRRQSGKLDELIQAVKDNGGDVAD